MTVLLRGAPVLDGTGADPRTASVLVDGERIRTVGDVAPPRDAEVVDLDGLTLLPGLIDAHTHLGLIWIIDPGPVPVAVAAAQIFENVELALLSGHTTVREVGGLDGGVARAIDMGLIPGPRLLPSGPALCQTGGHGDLGPPFLPHEHHRTGTPGLSQASVVCDGPDEVRVAARTAFRRGATQLKVCISGGVVSFTDRLEDTQFTVAELRAAVDEARARDTYVTAHAHNSQAIRNGLEAGLECFEHGTFLDEETAARMATAGAALIPTLAVIHLAADQATSWGIPEELVPRFSGVEASMAASVKLALDAGVAVGSGTDLLGPGQNRRGLEIALKAAIMGPMAAIVSATATSAAILRVGDRVGTVEEGKLADLIAVAGDPLAEPELFDDPDRVVLVIKGGQIVKDIRS